VLTAQRIRGPLAAYTLRSVVVSLLTLLAQGTPGLSQEGPDDLQRLLKMFYVLAGAGTLIALAGYAIPSKTLQIVGIALIFLGVGVFVAAVGSFG
jgi:hypothetical protein